MKVKYMSLRRGLFNTGTSHRAGSCCHYMCQKFFVDFSSPRVSAVALSALREGLFTKSFDSTAYLLPLGLGNVTIGHFPSELIHAAALPCVGFDFLF